MSADREENDRTAAEDKVQSQASESASVESGDWESFLSSLGYEEKFVFLIGLLALYGDGTISSPEIEVLREVVRKLDFRPAELIHRDPDDQNLCTEEKVAWALGKIRSTFTGASKLNDEEIVSLFEDLTKSIEQDIDNRVSDKKERRKYSAALKQLLSDIASADGKVSTKEEELIEVFKKTSKYQLSTRELQIVAGILFAAAYLVYELVT